MQVKTAVMTDSTSYIPKHIREDKNIHMVPLSVIFGDKVYEEEVTITADEFYELVKKESELPKTSQPSTGFIVDKLTELAKDYDAVISIHLSSGISGTYEGVVAAGEMVEGIEVYPFDSEVSAIILGFYALEAADLAAEGWEPEQIINRLNEMKQNIDAYFMVDDLSHLKRGGRLSGAQAFVGSMLQVKPVLCFKDKKIVPFEKIRTRKKALKRIEELFAEDAKTGKPIVASVIHANREKEAEAIKQELEARYPNVEVLVSYFGPVCGTHLGEGAMGLGWYMK